jgi:hypothetical protein
MIHITQDEYKWNEKQNIFYPQKYDDVYDALEKVPADEISGFGFEGIEDQEELLDMVNQEFTITE